MAEYNRCSTVIPPGAIQKTVAPLKKEDKAFFVEPVECFHDHVRLPMFETLMKNGNYRIDYLNRAAFGSAGAVALYVCAGVQEDETYSRMAKRQLLEGLNRVVRDFERQNLVAIYIDICAPEEMVRPAYEKMEVDLEAGIFHKVILAYSTDLLKNERVH